MPKYYQPTEIAFKVTANNETRVLAQFDVTAAMITDNTLTLDLPVGSTSPLRALLSNGQAVNIYLTGRYNVPDQAFANGAYNTVLHHPTITLTDQNNYSITQNAGSLNQTVLGIKGLFNLGNLVKITQGYTADYVNKDEGVPAGTVTVNKERTNTGSGFQTTLTPISNIPVDNLVISLQIPDGVNVHSLAMSSNNQGIKDLDPSYGVRITYTDGSTEWIKSIPATGQITGQAAKAIRSVSVKYAHYSYDDDLSFSMSHGTDFALAKAYPNGDAVRSGDLLVLKTAFQADDLQPTLVDSAYDRLTTYKENDQSGIYMAEVLGQAQQNPGAMNAGNITYEAAASAYGLPRLAHPIMYIQVPDNAIWDQSQPLEIKTGLTATWGNPDSEQLIPKSVTTFSVNGHTFLKVDLSNYPEVEQGFSVIVHYNNGLDYLTSTKHSPFMVVADNLNQNVSNVNHPIAAHLEARDQATFEALMQEERINVQTASYNNGDDAYGRSSWTINTADGTSSETMTQGNTYSAPSLTAVQKVDGTDPTHFKVYGSLINADPDTKIDNATQVINLPSTSDGKSQFTPVLTGPVTLTDPNTVTDLSKLATITYYTDRADLDKGAASLAGKTGLTADQVTDWSQIKAVKVVFTSQLDRPLTARVTMNMVDNHIYDHVGKTIYASSVIYSTDPKQGEALPKVVIHPGDRASAKLTVTGTAMVKTLVHYVDAAGGEHYVALPDKAVTYNDGTDTMKRADFMTGAGDLTTNDHLLLPEHMVLDYAHPTIKNSTATYAAGYPNGTAEFGQPVQYDFDGDAVVFEGKVAKQVTQNHQVTETIHYVKADGSQASADVVQKSRTFLSTGYQNPFTGEISWSETGETDTLPAVPTPAITGYTPDQTAIAAVTVSTASPNIVKTVTYTPNNEAGKVQYIDDSDNGKVLREIGLQGKFGEDSGYNTKDALARYYQLGYDLVSDSTNGHNIVFNTGDNFYKVHLKFVGHRVSVKIIDDSTGKTLNDSFNVTGRVGARLSADQLSNPVNDELAQLTKVWYDYNGNEHTDGKYAPFQLVSNGFAGFDGKIAERDLAFEIHVRDNIIHENLDIPLALPPIVQVDPAYADQLAQAYTKGITNPQSDPNHQELVEHAHLLYGTLVPNIDGQVDPLYPHYNYASNITYNLDGTPITYQGESADQLLAQAQGLKKANHLNVKLTFDFNLAENQYGGTNGVFHAKLSFGNYQGFDTTGYHDLKMLVLDPSNRSYKWLSLANPTVLQANMSAEDYVRSIIDQSAQPSIPNVDGIFFSPMSNGIQVYYTPNYRSGYGTMIPGTTIAQQQYQQSMQDGTTPYMPQNDVGYPITYITMVPDTEEATISYIDDTTGATLATDQAHGDYHSVISFATDPETRVSGYQAQNYELVSNNFAAGTKYGLTNRFEVHLKHRTSSANESRTVTETVHYQYADGTTAKPDRVQAVTFTRTKLHDLVTNTDTGAWSQDGQHTFAEVASPVIAGYLPDQPRVAPVAVTPDSGNLTRTVIYQPVDEHNTIKFVDDGNNQRQVGPVITISGKTGTSVELRLAVPAGYVLAPGQTLPTAYTFMAQNEPIIIHLVKKPVITPGQPGSHASALNPGRATLPNNAPAASAPAQGDRQAAGDKTLPQTGAANGGAAIGLGVASLLGMLGLAGLSKKRG
ncbi:mucin-binding protein [Limosilactobacillus antri]|uniref:mucin-binding protein n=1 Tax=Limosilactobacillus antri TaxID=227943 RepID=UPI001F57F344|nr:hypothetical protein [Limosilactobacillus antri]